MREIGQFTTLQASIILFTPNTPHQTMRYKSLDRYIAMSTELALPRS